MAKSYKYHRSRKPLDLEKAKLRMTDAIKAMEKIILDDSYPTHEKIQAANALNGLISRYSKLLETTDLEKRLVALEEKFQLKKVV